MDIEGTIELGSYQVIEHKTRVNVIHGIEVSMRTNFYYCSLSRYRYNEYRVIESLILFWHAIINLK